MEDDEYRLTLIYTQPTSSGRGTSSTMVDNQDVLTLKDMAESILEFCEMCGFTYVTEVKFTTDMGNNFTARSK